MSTILSDITVAQQRATALSSALEGLVQGGKATKDEQTTILGNNAAANAIDAGDAPWKLSKVLSCQLLKTFSQ